MCEKSLENIWIYEINAVTLHPLSRQKMLLATAQGAEKVLKNFLKKKFRKNLEVSKRCLTFATAFALKNIACNGAGSEKVLKKFFEKSFKKFGRLKKTPYLCTTFALIKKPRCKTGRFGQRPNQIEFVL